MNPTIAEQDEVVVGSVEQAPSIHWVLASLSLSMLLSLSLIHISPSPRN